MSPTLTEIRDQIADKLAELGALDNQYLSRDEAIARVDAYLDASASAMQTSYSGLYNRKPHIVQIFAESVNFDPFNKELNGVDMGPVLASFMRKQFREHIIEQIDDEVAGEWGLDKKLLEKTRTALTKDILALEFEEETLASELEKLGQTILRRTNIQNPLVTIVKNQKALTR